MRVLRGSGLCVVVAHTGKGSRCTLAKGISDASTVGAYIVWFTTPDLHVHASIPNVLPITAAYHASNLTS